MYISGKLVYVLSYGSNSCFNRIQRRIPSVRKISIVKLPGYQLKFNKRSLDGSTKANIQSTGSEMDEVWSVLHLMPEKDMKILDRIEGLGKGYEHHNLRVMVEGVAIEARAYMATAPAYLAEGKPYDWYHSYVIHGARENNFPEDYIRKILSIKSRRDPDSERRRLNLDVLSLL